MRVHNIMNPTVRSCKPDDTLNRAAQMMWEGACGAIPVVDGEYRPVGFLTDRDICMAAYTQGKTLEGLRVQQAMAHKVVCCREADDINEAMRLMGDKGLRRLPVVDAQGKLAGILSLDDLACEAGRHLRGGENYELRGHVADVWIAISHGRVKAQR